MPPSPTPNDQATQVNTGGGPAIGHDVNIDKGDFVSRDKIEHHHHYHDSVQPPSPTTPRGIFGLYPFNEHFFGRDEELATLHTLLQTESNVSICPVITGMGGLGKTQLAAHYARNHVNDYPDGIFWITAANLNEIRPQLADFCVALGLPVADPQRSGDLTDQKISAFKSYFDQHPDALLIFDNVEEPDHLRTRQIGVQLTALTLGGKVIVTTRRRKLLGDRFAELALQRLLPTPARQILITARPDLATDPDLDRLCEQFGYLPLMLNLAAAALRKRGGLIAGYLQRLQTLGAEKLHSEVAKVSLDDYHASLTAVLTEQWHMVADEDARLLLRVAGQLSEAVVIPIARLGLLAGLYDVDEWVRPLSDALEQLSNASLVEAVDGETVRLHPLVREFAESLTSPDKRSTFHITCAQRLVDAYCNDLDGMQRLGQEYAQRGIAAIRLDLITALNLCQYLMPATSSLISVLRFLLQILRLESANLLGEPIIWRPERLWQQIVQRAFALGIGMVEQQALKHLRKSLHWKPKWIVRNESLALEQTLSYSEIGVNAITKLDEQHIISTSNDYILKVWNLQTGTVEQIFTGHEDNVNAVAILDEQRIISASDDCTLKVWNLSTGTVEQTLTGHKHNVNAVAILDEQRIISASADHTLKVWKLSTETVEQTLMGHEGGVNAVAILDEQRIISASADHTLKIWNLSTGTVEQTLTGHHSDVNVVAKLDEQRVVSAAGDGNNEVIKIWNLQTNTTKQILIGHKDMISAVVRLDEQRIVTASYDHMLKVWNLETGTVAKTLIDHAGRVNAIAILDEQHIISASHDHTLKVWNLRTHIMEQKLVCNTIVSNVWALNAQHVVSGHRSDSTLRFWNLRTGQVEHTLTGYDYYVNAMVVLDTQRIIVAVEGKFEIWNLHTGQIEQKLIIHENFVRAMLALDEQHIVCASYDHIFKVWNLQTGEVKQTFIGHESKVNALAILDTQHVVSASDDRTLKVWNLQTGKETTSIGLDDALKCVVVIHQEARTLIVAGDASGALYCLELVEPVGGAQGSRSNQHCLES